MNQNRVESELRFLKTYAVFLTFVCLVLFGFIFKNMSSPKFDEIDVERINVVEKNGRIRMVISNQMRQHPGTMDGITFDDRKGQRPAGMIFFGANGNEVGGLVYDGNEGKGQGGSLTFDKFRGDQTIQLVHDEDKNENYFAGIKMNDQKMPLVDLMNRQIEISKLPTKEAQDLAYKALRDQGLLMTERLRIGKDYDKSSIIKMRDALGRVRIELRVEAGGSAKLSFLDELGKVVYSLPPGSKPNAVH